MSYPDRIRAGDFAPWTDDYGTEAEGARRSAAIAADELDTLDPHELERRAGLEAVREAWLDRAALLEERSA